MEYKDYIKLGLNHHMLNKMVVGEPSEHMRTLLPLLDDERFEILDLWIPAREPYRSMEINALRTYKKDIYYNIGSREGEKEANPASLLKKEYQYAIDFFKREIDMALEVGAKKIVVYSGKDVPENRIDAFKILTEFCCEICRYVPDNVLLMIEPADRDLDKRFLIGPSAEALKLIRKVNDAGCYNFAAMIDMCHIPLMGETLRQAFDDLKGHIGHTHMGNCILKNKSHPLFGDRHVTWGIDEGEYDSADLAEFFKAGLETGYFNTLNRGSASFEMIPYEGMSGEDSVNRFISTLKHAWDYELAGKEQCKL